MGRRPFLAAALLLLVAGLVALGIWQLQRRAWKLALIAQVERRLAVPPVAAPGPERWGAIGKDDTYTRVMVRGQWRAVAPVLTQATTALGGGHWVMAPLATDRGFTVLVNRGFVAAEDRRGLTPPAGPVRVTGLLRISEPGGGFLRSNVPAENRWYSRDVAAIARALHLADQPSARRPHRGDGERIAPYFIDADAIPGITAPRGGLTVVRFPNNHLVYALTWFAMAALLAFATWRVAGNKA